MSRSWVESISYQTWYPSCRLPDVFPDLRFPPVIWSLTNAPAESWSPTSEYREPVTELANGRACPRLWGKGRRLGYAGHEYLDRGAISGSYNAWLPCGATFPS